MTAALQCVALLEREVTASYERVLENVLDWEHLPWLHRASFAGIRLVEAGRDGWSAWVDLPSLPPAGARRAVRIEVRLDRPSRRYVTRTLEGPGTGTEIWTRLAPHGARRTGIRVEFLVPGVAPTQVDAVGAAYRTLYERLWDEDESMMVRRQRWLDRSPVGAASPEPLPLGPVDGLHGRLPLSIVARGRTWVVRAQGGALVAHAGDCPHQGGPLAAAELDGEGRLVCPWHGYRFDLRTGAGCDGRTLRLAAAPAVRVDVASGEAALVWPDGDPADTCVR
jgi:nitrite reductase/ring-hydroxylating ferredoxin subunit